jgi:dihydroneopterin triphosphate diphosphatase
MPTSAPAAPRAESDWQFRRPESVLVVVYTPGGEFLLMQRHRPTDFWQSVTGSMHWQETAASAACRELGEETGLVHGVLKDLNWAQSYAILPAFGHRYAPGVTQNLEHAFAFEVAAPYEIRLSPSEHAAYRWLATDAALALASSSSNRAVIERLRAELRL